MGSKFISILLSLIIIILISCMVILGINIYMDFFGFKIEVGSYEYVPEYQKIEKQNILKTLGLNINFSDKIQNIQSENFNKYMKGNSLQMQNTDMDGENTVVNVQNVQPSGYEKYYYKQLNKYSKIIYDGLLNNKTNMITGTYKIEFGNKFSELLKSDNGENLIKNYYQTAIEAFIYDNPDVFYLETTKIYLNIEKTTRGNNVTYNVFLDNGKEENYLIDGFEPEDIKQKISQVKQIKDNIINNLNGTTYQKILTIHNYLVDNINYEQTLLKDNIRDIYGALLNNESVCEGYAKAFKYLADEAGIDSVIVIGNASNSEGRSEKHAWNYVLLDDVWYAIDCTWDDPIIIGNGKLSNKSKFKYFLKGLNTISVDHFPCGQFTEGGNEFKYPELSIEDY